MKKFIVFSLLVTIVLAWHRNTRSPFGNSREENLTILRNLAAELNRDLPMRIDEETTILRVDVTERGVINRYQLATPLATFRMLPPGVFEEIRRDLRRMTCSNRSYRAAMRKGFTISYEYSTARGIPIGMLTYRNSDCFGMRLGSVEEG